MVYTQPIWKTLGLFKEEKCECCSEVASFSKRKPFYITNANGREKESYLCNRCLNTHLLSVGINNFWKINKLTTHASATKFVKEQYITFPAIFKDSEHDEMLNKFLECVSEKEVSLWCVARFGNICTILKTWKTPMEEC